MNSLNSIISGLKQFVSSSSDVDGVIPIGHQQENDDFEDSFAQIGLDEQALFESLSQGTFGLDCHFLLIMSHLLYIRV